MNEQEQWFSTFLMLKPFHAVPRVAVTPPNQNIIFVATHNYNFATAMTLMQIFLRTTLEHS